MELALYAPGLGYYARDASQLGRGLGDGSDFVTAPELSPLFGQTLALQVAEALQATGTDEVWEFGAGTGALAGQLLGALAQLGQPLRRYTIVDVSGALRGRQQARLAAHAPVVQWADRLPEAMRGVVLGNEVLDAMPVRLLARVGGNWHERGVVVQDTCAPPRLGWADRPTALRPPLEVAGTHDYLTEVHPRAEAFVRTLAERLQRGGRGAAFFIDYGFPEAEYYHPQRAMGTLACHRAHRMDDDPLADVGEKDITAHVNFTGIALAAQEAGLAVLGYTSQGRFLLNCGLTERLETASIPQGAAALKLVAEHEMGELFKVIGLAVGEGWAARGFAAGDRTHRL
ncbi:MAG TPA: SAM-dependent methyltransferase [Ottowia sp.]|uniref:class I SAM-dependent methyltransferase n=1 Tax=Ottowia sp. TaxID=1898956 RepID=UPI002BE3FCAE|nr:SAM-dependent methyltransferase [Ottowia sp.]HMN22345.1 SAM-dependent methyltransferase [Ottowia sp.]